MCIGQNWTVFIGSTVLLMQGVASPHSAASTGRHLCRKTSSAASARGGPSAAGHASAALARPFPNWSVGQLGWLLLRHRYRRRYAGFVVSDSGCTLGSAAGVLFLSEELHLSERFWRFNLQSTPQDTPSLTTHSRQMPWTTTDFPPLYNMPQQTT